MTSTGASNIESASRSRGRGKRSTPSPPQSLPASIGTEGGAMEKLSVNPNFDSKSVSSSGTKSDDFGRSLDGSSNASPRGPRGAAVVAAKKAPAIDRAQKINVVTNIFAIQTKKGTIVYRYDVNIIRMMKNSADGRSICRGERDDAAVTYRRQLCRDLLAEAFRRFESLGCIGKFVYDGTSTLFTAREFEQLGFFTLDYKNLPEKIQRQEREGTHFKVEIAPCSTGKWKLDISDFTNEIPQDVSQWDRSLRAFFEMLTSQHAADNKTHVLFGNGKLYLDKTKQVYLKEGKMLCSGADKGVRFIGEQKSIVPALILDSKKASFFTSQSLDKTVLAMVGRPDQLDSNGKRELNKQLKDLRVFEIGNPRATYLISGLTSKSVSNLMSEDSITSLLEHFAAKGVQVKYPNWPAVQIISRPIRYFPMEALQIASNQRVGLEKQTRTQMQTVIKECTVQPSVRYNEINANLQALNLHDNGKANQYLEQFGVTLDRTPIQLKASIRNPPAVKYADVGNTKVNAERANWRFGRFLKPATVKSWAVFYMNPLFERDVRDFVHNLVLTAKDKGVQISLPNIVSLIEPTNNAIEQEMEKAFKRKMQFVMLVAGTDSDMYHGYLKLMEAKFQVITQHVTEKIAQKMNIECKANKRMTVENIVAKLNMKNFGTCHNVIPESYCRSRWLSSNETMIIGYDVAHPKPISKIERRLGRIAPQEPSVIGFSFNGAANPETFIGDYHYQEARKEEVTWSILTERIKWMLACFKKNRKRLPKYIVVVRDGVSEGQFAMVIRDELGALRQGVEEFAEGYKPLFAVITTTKRHSKRFFALTPQGKLVNPPPGMVVDHTITLPNVNEYFMQSHYPIQGTAKATEYHALVDEMEMSIDEVQSMCLALCYEHQINTGATSLPEPVYQADEWAKRGQSNFIHFRDNYGEILRKYCLNSESEIDFEKLTAKLCYKEKALEQTRANA